VSDAIVASELVKRYASLWRRREPTRPALAGLDLTVPTGGITGLLGPNGAGKSTAIKLLLGLARPTSGSAVVLGNDIRSASLAIRRAVSYVPEERAFFGWMRAGDFTARIARVSSTWDTDLAARLAERWRIDQRARLRELSSGTRSRLMLLVALARRAALLILDEPTTGLDPAAVDDALGELAVAAADGATVLLVTHRLEEVERICDRVVVMNAGRAVLDGDLDDLRAAWRVIEVASHPAPERMERWAEVASMAPFGDRSHLLVRSDPAGVVERLRMLGAEVTDVRPLAFREIYLAVTGGSPDARRDDLA
jgi:ABC-2 type transport system ATP-binding protein